jgi:hypothetical protein
LSLAAATRVIATLIAAAVEETVAMCRAERSIEPLDRVADELTRVVSSLVGPG